MNKRISRSMIIGLLGLAFGVSVTFVNRPTEVSATTISANQLHVSSSVNSYIASHKLSPVGITKELHTFEIFSYSTPDKKPNGVVFHQTANPHTYSARNEADYEINGGHWQNAFVHTFIDANTILNIHDIEKGCWGAGPYANHRFVQFELVTARNSTEFAKSINNAAWYVAYLADHFGWTLTLASQNAGIGTLWTHYDVSHILGGTDHVDPIQYLADHGYNTTQFYDLANAYYRTLYPSPLNGGKPYDKVTSTTAVNLPGKIAQNGRSDGFYSAPYYTTKATIHPNSNAASRNGQVVQVLKKATTNRSAATGNTFYQVRFVDGSTYWTDARGVSVENYAPISNQISVNYQARIKQTGRNDGLYPDGPYNTKLSNIYPNANAPKFNNEVVPVTAEATTSNGTYCQIRLNNGQLEWLDKRGLTTDVYDHVIEKGTMNAVGRIQQAKRTDGLYSAPFLTDSLTTVKNKNAAQFDGQPVQVLQSATTDDSASPEGNSFYQIRLTSGKVYWINKAGIKLVNVDQVTNTQKLNFEGRINESGRKDGLYSAPWNTDALSITENHNAVSFNGQDVQVLAQSTTSRSASLGNSFYQIRLKDGRTYWTDARAIKVIGNQPVTNLQSVHYTAMIDQTNRQDGLYLHPYNSNADSIKPNTDAVSYSGRGVEVTALGTVSQGTYAEITLPDGKVRWIDRQALKSITYDKVIKTEKMSQTAVINQSQRQDGLYSAPWNTDGMSILENHNARIFNNQPVTITNQSTTSRSANAGNLFDEIQLSNGQKYWIDARGVSFKTYQPVTNSKTVSYTAMIDQTNREDGLYLHPYQSNSDSMTPNTDALAYAGRGVQVTALATVAQGTYAQITLPGGAVKWIDTLALKAVSYDRVVNTKPMAQKAVVNQTHRQDGLYSAPWNTDAMSLLENHNAKMFNNQSVTIINQATTSRSATIGNLFDEIKLSSGETYWIDARGVTPSNK